MPLGHLRVERVGFEDASWMYWGIGLHLGVPWPQNVKGHLLGDVKDQGKSPNDPDERCDGAAHTPPISRTFSPATPSSSHSRERGIFQS